MHVVSSTAAVHICDCHKCGGPIYANLVHFCQTAIGPIVWAGWSPNQKDKL